MVQYSKSGEAVLVGVISTNLLCGVRGVPGAHLRTAALAGWIREATRGAVHEVRETETQTVPGVGTGVVAGIVVGAVAGAAVAVAVAVLAVWGGRRWRRRRRAEAQVVQDGGDGAAGEPEGPYVPADGAAGEAFLGTAWGGGAGTSASAWGSADADAAAVAVYAGGGSGGGGAMGFDYSRAGLPETGGTAPGWDPEAGLPEAMGRRDGGEGGEG